jgi:hypothetical protein
MGCLSGEALAKTIKRDNLATGLAAIRVQKLKRGLKTHLF